ncbi:MAG: hypothetical protein HY013_13530 [Candidatus Solibacter usitatus]|nr:hypothetical protein [Candidatus Solibacter usitatus]
MKKPKPLSGEDQPITMSGAGSIWFSWLGPDWYKTDAYSWKRPTGEVQTGTLNGVEIQIDADDYSDTYAIDFPANPDDPRTAEVWISPAALERRFVFAADKAGLNLSLTSMAKQDPQRFRLGRFAKILASQRTNITYHKNPNFQKVVVTNGQKPVCNNDPNVVCQQSTCRVAASCVIDCSGSGVTCSMTLKYSVN